MSTSRKHRANANRINAIEDTGKVHPRKIIAAHWVNNLEEIAKDMVGHHTLGEKEELEFAFTVMKDYEKRMIRYVNARPELRKIIEAGMSRYNTIIAKAKLDEKYMLGASSA